MTDTERLDFLENLLKKTSVVILHSDDDDGFSLELEGCEPFESEYEFGLREMN